jgi:arylsulfatase A-like enzyme
VEGAAVSGRVNDPAASRLQFRVEVPAGGALELAGEILAGEETADAVLGPATFTAEVGGKQILRRTLGTEGVVLNFGVADEIYTYSGLDFAQRIGLDDYAGKTIDLTLRIESEVSDDITWWTKIHLMRSEEIPRNDQHRAPNVLLIMVDTLRADHLGVYGYERPVSPNLDQLGAESLVFERAIAQSAWTQPSTATLFTGLYPLEHGVVGAVPLPHSIETIGSALQKHGFTTVAISANPIIGRREGFDRGFEDFVEIPWANATAMFDIFDLWLEENSTSRWFAYLHYIDPHTPFLAPEPFYSAFTGNYAGVLTNPRRRAAMLAAGDLGKGEGFTQRDLDFLRAQYDGEILYWDSEFGRLLAMMRERGALDDTVIVVVGDHGEAFLEHGVLFHGGQLYEESIRVPLLIWAPGRVNPGRVTGTVELRGVMDTILGLAHARSALADDRRLIDVETFSQAAAFSHTALAYTEGEGLHEIASVSQGGWKYIRRLDNGESELFNIHSDPGETVNLVMQKPEIASRYRALLEEHLLETRAHSGSGPDPGMVQKLRALGYVQ